MKSSWWFFAVLVFFSIFYFNGMRKKEAVLAELMNRVAQAEAEKAIVLEEQEELKLQLDSQNDPKWIELVLMKNLGMTPEGKRKVCFQNEP